MRPIERFEIDSCISGFLGMKRIGTKNCQGIPLPLGWAGWSPTASIQRSLSFCSILLSVADGTDARRGLRISFVVLLHVWQEEFRGDFAEGAKMLSR